jgi:hypothetical protein
MQIRIETIVERILPDAGWLNRAWEMISGHVCAFVRFNLMNQSLMPN